MNERMNEITDLILFQSPRSSMFANEQVDKNLEETFSNGVLSSEDIRPKCKVTKGDIHAFIECDLHRPPPPLFFFLPMWRKILQKVFKVRFTKINIIAST